MIDGEVAQTVSVDGAEFFGIIVENKTAPVNFEGSFKAYEFVCISETGSGNIIFEAGKLVTVGNLTLAGDSGSPNISLSSSIPGTPWLLKASGYRTVSGVSVTDSDASSGLGIPATDSSDGGGNANWEFGAVTSLWAPTSGNKFHTAANWSTGIVPDENTRVWVKTGTMTIDQEINVKNFVIGGSGSGASVRADVPLRINETLTLLDKAELTLNKPTTINGDFIMRSGALLTHTANAATDVNKIDLTVLGNVMVYDGALVDVSTCGYGRSQGPGNTGGIGAGYGGAADRGGVCYGSVIAPTNLGSGANYGSGGGAVLIHADGTIRWDGTLVANGDGSSYSSGSGGSIYFVSANLTGYGQLQANGGDFPIQNYPGGGGRISLVLTDPNADFSDCFLDVEARGGRLPSMIGGPGTVYREKGSDEPGSGTVTIGPSPIASSYGAELPPREPNIPQESVRATFVIKENAMMKLIDDYRVGDIYIEATGKLDLGGHTLYVNTPEHALGPGSLVGLGKIEWWKPPGGTVYFIR